MFCYWTNGKHPVKTNKFSNFANSPQNQQSKSMEWKFKLGKQIQTLNNDNFI